MFRVATEESNALPNEATTAVPPGKASNYMVKEKKTLQFVVLSVTDFLRVLVFFFLFVMEGSKRFMLVFFVQCRYRRNHCSPR